MFIYIYTKIKNNLFHVRNIYIYILDQILRDLLSNINRMFIFENANNSIATKLCANLLNNRKKSIFLVHDTIQ